MSTSTTKLFKSFWSGWFGCKWIEMLASYVKLKATGFTGNLDGTVTDVQLLANKVDQLPLGGGLPAGTENQTVRYNASNVLEATSYLTNDNIANVMSRPLEIELDGSAYGHFGAALDIITQNTKAIYIKGDGGNGITIETGKGIGIEIFGGTQYGVGYRLQDGITITDAERSGLLICSRHGNAYKPIQLWNSFDGYTGQEPNVQFEVDANGKIKAWKKYKKGASGVTGQFNNLVVDELGNFEKQKKNIGILLTDQLITSGGWAEVPDMHVHPIRSNYYHCQFRFVLKRLMQNVPYDTFGASGFCPRFTNDGVVEIEILGGIEYQYQYSDGINDQACGGAFDNMKFGTAPYYINNPDIQANSTDSAEYLIVSGDFVFLQSSNCDDLKCYVTKQVADEDYTVEKGSFVKISLKNED